jgi:hypothetical protein
MPPPVVHTALPDHVVRHLTGGQLSVVSSIEEDGRPVTTLMSWVVALSPTRIVLCVDSRSRTYFNLVERPAAAMEILGDGLTWGVKGRARLVKQRMESTPFPCAIIEIAVEEARDHAAPGTFFQGPTYRYEDGKAHRVEFEARIFAELRTA